MKNFYFLAFCFFCWSASSQIINFPDAKFKAKLLQSVADANPAYYFIAADVNQIDMVVDTNGNGEIEVSEAQAVYYLTVQGITSQDAPTDLTDLTGIEYFTNLRELNCADNVLTSLNVSALTNMTYFRCDRNNITSLNIDGLNALTYFAFGGNAIPYFDVSHLVNLHELYCDSNGMLNLDVSALPNLELLLCQNNSLQSLDLSQNKLMRGLFCDHNQLSLLDISNFNTFSSLHANDNPLLQNVIMKFGKVFDYQNMTIYNMDFSNCPNLKYICVDDFNISAIETKMANDYNYPECHVNSYCSFTPGGNYYSLQGQFKFDYENDGCENNNNLNAAIKVTVDNFAFTGSFLSGNSGSYNIPIQQGTYTITPQIENGANFNISPSSANLNFGVNNNPVIQNFCITANGIHPDLEVVILPVAPARPGFDATYKLIYKNKGNITQSGSVSFTFEDSKIDFVSANPNILNQSGNILSWNFTNLLPFETRTIFIALNANSPMEIPGVNIGDQLNFGATVYPTINDEMVGDNVFGFKQIVIGSIDPNDKTCLEGNVITPEMIGEYIHYLVRFENTGNANAENIVVKDIIDTTKFDISTLIPLNGSHPFETRISDTNKVEFIFENINLPFDDANNDGYVAFKIKTKPNLVVGDTFSNSANIYFDYNFPIVTNTATTTITTLGTSDFEFSKYFTLWPNPVKNKLNITTKNVVAISSISIYNLLGQLVQVTTNVSNPTAVDVSDLKTGDYFIKINSDKGITTAKIIKE